MAKRARVLNINRGTRIKAGLTLQDMMLLSMVSLLAFLLLAAVLPNALARFTVAAALGYGSLRLNGHLKETYGPNFLQEYLLFIFSPDEYGPAEDPHPVSVLAKDERK